MVDLPRNPQSSPGTATRHIPAVLAGVSGCLLLVLWTSPRYSGGVPPFLTWSSYGEINGVGWWYVAVPMAATAIGLCALRWWPHLLVVAGLLAVPGLVAELSSATFPLSVQIVVSAGHPLAIVGVLACAQGLFRKATGWCAVIVGLSVGAHLFGSVVFGAGWLISYPATPTWPLLLVAIGFVVLLPAAWQLRRGDLDAIGLPDARWSWRRIRAVVTGVLATGVVIMLSFLTTDRLAGLLGVSWSALNRRQYAVFAILGAIGLVAVLAIAAVAGPWSLAGVVTAATVRVAIAAPMALVLVALAFAGPLLPVGALAGIALGALAAGSRWRVPLAGTLTVLAATVLFIAFAATGGNPAKLADQRSTIPALLILVLVTAAATAVVGATAPVMAPRGTLPAMLGPVAAVLTGSGLQTVEVTYLRDGLPESSFLNSVNHLTTSAGLLLVAGAALAGLGYAQHFAARRAERRHAEQIQREATAAERERLARPIHDGVLQVLALVQRRGSQLGEPGAQLAALAAEQEVALRTLLSGGSAAPDGATTTGRANEDLRPLVASLASPTVEVATPAEPVLLPARTATELAAAVRAALDNVRWHAGPGAQAWVLLEGEPDAVRITVRDNGVGFSPERLAEAAAAGRLGVAQSMRGRVQDLGGTATIHSRPGEGTEVELWAPRHPPDGR